MTGILIGMVGAAGAIGGWVVVASFVYCRLSGHMALFVFPFDQWLDIVPYWSVTGWTKAYVVVSAAAASLSFVVAIIAASRLYKQGWRLSVYGNTRWAQRGEMTAQSISTSRRPF